MEFGLADAATISNYEPVIGLEVHVQLRTKTKIFSHSTHQFGRSPNTQTDPVVLGLPGALPVLNKEAVSLAVRAALAVNCHVNAYSRFARKNYFYPDLPKGYQISQFDQPLAEHGWLDIEMPEGRKRIGVTRLHMEDSAIRTTSATLTSTGPARPCARLSASPTSAAPTSLSPTSTSSSS